MLRLTDGRLPGGRLVVNAEELREQEDRGEDKDPGGGKDSQAPRQRSRLHLSSNYRPNLPPTAGQKLWIYQVRSARSVVSTCQILSLEWLGVDSRAIVDHGVE